MHYDTLIFLLTKPEPRLVGRVCQSPDPVDRGPRHSAGPCTRPVWMDDLCSRCWASRMAFHGQWTLFQANPAASLLSGDKIRSMEDIFGGTGFRTYLPEDW